MPNPTEAGGPSIGFLGDLLEDIVVHPRREIRPDTDTPCAIVRRRGGSAANAAVAAAGVLGPGRVRFLGQVGNDAAGDRLLEELAAAGVQPCVRRGGRSGTVVVLVGADNTRTMLTDRGACAGFAGFDHGDTAWLENLAILHVAGYSLLAEPSASGTRRMIDEVRRAGGTISVDACSVGAITDSEAPSDAGSHPESGRSRDPLAFREATRPTSAVGEGTDGGDGGVGTYRQTAPPTSAAGACTDGGDGGVAAFRETAPPTSAAGACTDGGDGGVAAFRETLAGLAPDVLLCDAAEASLLGVADTSGPRLAEVVVVKDGPRPTRLYGEGFDGEPHAPPPLEDIADTTGAGDAFAGGLLAARLEGHSWPEAVAAAHNSAAAHLLALRDSTPPRDSRATAEPPVGQPSR